MKRIAFVLSLLSFTTQAQIQHPCAQAKIKSHANMNARTASMLASTALVNQENQYDLQFYHLNLTMSNVNKSISGNVRTLATVKATQLDTFAFELYSTYTIDSIVSGGVHLTVLRSGDEGRGIFTVPLIQGSPIDVTVYYHGTAPTINGANAGDGYNNGTSPTWGNKSGYTLSECYHAYEWFPVKQQLTDKLDSNWVFVTTDSSLHVGSNGTLSNVVTIGNQKRYEWKNNQPIDYYLISVAMANYMDYSIYAHPQGTTDSILIQNYIYNNASTFSYVKPIVDSTVQFMELFCKLYGMYPWVKYGHSETVLGGGMEHQTMTTIGAFDWSTIAHELAHQWFGDYVTCGTWHDIWLNEGFADYSEYIVRQYLEPDQAFSFMAQQHTDVMSSSSGSVYCADTTNENAIFSSRLTYEKGGSIVHTLRFVINNDSVFFPALRNYLNQYQHSTATTEQFKASIEAFTGLDLTQFFDQWIYGQGYPSFNVHWNQVGNNFIMSSAQTVSDAAVTPLFITPIQYTLVRSIGDTTILVNHNTATMNYSFNVAGTVTAIYVDSADWIINKATVTHDATMGIAQVKAQNDEFKIYPNPTSATLQVSGVKQQDEIRIYDVLGKEVLNAKQTTFDVSSLTEGVYFIRVGNNVQKFVKQ